MNAFTERKKSDAARTPGKRYRAKLATRARILEVAKPQLETLGFEGTGIRGVGEAAGVATGTVLLHCADKRDLLHAAMFEDLQAQWQRTRDARGERALPRESLFADPPWSARFAEQVADVHRQVAALAERAKLAGELAEQVDSHVFAASFFSFIPSPSWLGCKADTPPPSARSKPC